MSVEASSRPHVWILSLEPEGAGRHPDAEARVFGLTARERLRRSLLRAGVSGIDILAPGEPVPACSEKCLVLRGDLFYDERILGGLLGGASVVLEHPLHEGGEAIPVAAASDPRDLAAVVEALRDPERPLPVGLTRAGVLDLAPAYDTVLRKVDVPFVYPASVPADRLVEIENRVFAASYKGITDLVTKWVFPRPARAVVRALAHLGIQPNTVTAVSYGLAIAVTWLFAEGEFASGLALAWLMTFLDTVDGKLARCTLTSTRFGNVFDHALDLVHPPIWWAAWAAGLPGGIPGNELAFWVVVGGYVAGRALEGVFELAFGIPFFVWKPFDAVFRQVIARRNPNLILLTGSVLLGRPAWGFAAVAIWTLICLAIAAARNLQAHLEARRGVRIHSWLDDLQHHEEAGRIATSTQA